MFLKLTDPPLGSSPEHQFSNLSDRLFNAKWFQGDLTIKPGDVCIPSQPPPPPHLVHVWVPVLIVCCLGSCAVHPGEECWLGQVHGRRADTKHLSNPLLNPLPHIPAKITHSTKCSVSDTSLLLLLLFSQSLKLQLRNHGEHTHILFSLKKKTEGEKGRERKGSQKALNAITHFVNWEPQTSQLKNS